ncbi:alpha/beta fold hydrolase [Microbulbifer sp. GL-2]|uniref:alpha/beta fold hydrolase n=1 Tax=Microbulbifer sp. GL-2 TaxID=2591606 RepID=UPI001162E82C|nr:alpha/beta hydrolase [Microbulbifer sp. GL-2]BBM01335.1 hydrolase signal peptide protein [Microbulbifer sp. GL-2]
MNKPAERFAFTTSDGVTLRYLQAGSGPTLLILHGWSQGAALFKHQLAGLSDHLQVIALDMRGHGLSDKPSHGYRIARLAKDLQELITVLRPYPLYLLGHSAGASVIWSYLEMFGDSQVSKLVFIDEPAALLADPGWSEKQCLDAGAIITPDGLYQFTNQLIGPDAERTTRNILESMVTPVMSPQERDELLAINLQFPRTLAARLFIDNVTRDWRDFIPRIQKPTMITFGRASPHPVECQQWIHKQILGSRLEIIEASDGGSHFLFLEAARRFNALLRDFLG